MSRGVRDFHRLLLVVGLWFLGTPAVGQPTPLPQPEAAIGAAADDLFQTALEARRINAAAVVLVQDGEVRLARTYGFEDLGRDIAAVPDETMLPIGSITKTFTGLAIAQLVASGQIRSIDDPVNNYLQGFQIEGDYGSSVSIRHLLTHTSGFDDAVYGFYSDTLDGSLPDQDAYRDALPPFVRRPGEVTAYSNAGASLLGAVIEGASGERYGAYVQSHIFWPAGMARSQVVYKTPVARQVQVYERSDTGAIARRTVYSNAVSAPSGNVAVTATDMGRYMLALLEPVESGAFAQPAISAAFTPLNAVHSGVQAHAALFEHMDLGGATMLHHGGSLPGHQSWMFLFPDHRTGLFVYVSDWQLRPLMPFEPGFWFRSSFKQLQPMGIGEATIPLRTALLATLGVQPSGKLPDQSAPANAASEYAGLYRGARRVHGTMFKFMSVIFPDVIEVQTNAKGLMVNGQGPYERAGPDLFVDAATGQRLGFASGPGGERTLATMTFRSSAYEKIAGSDDPRPYGQFWWIMIGLTLTGLAAFLWPKRTGTQRAAALVAAVAAISSIAVPLALFAADNNGFQFLFGGNQRLITARVFANLFVVLAPALTVVSFLAWRGQLWPSSPIGLLLRLHVSLLAATSTALLAFYWTINFLGLRFP